MTTATAAAVATHQTNLRSPLETLNYGAKYHGAVVEDLQLPPAFSLPSHAVISKAIELAYERDFSYIPVLDGNRKPLGYLNVAKLKERWEAGQANPDDKVVQYMTRFKRGPSEPYTLITPLTTLEDLESFLSDKDFALVTDYDRKFLLAVATTQDLENFAKRLGSAI